MKRLLGLFLIVPALALPQEIRLSVPYTKAVLPNGLTVILHEDHGTPTVSVNTWYHVGSGREKPGRTGFAHLFEHLMFMGSANVPEGKFDQWLEAAGGDNNASTSEDWTNYYEDVPSNAIELPLFLESDRMLSLAGSITREKLDLQRDVVKNERRESYENAPYGMAPIIIDEHLYPANHPYHWPTIGSMNDLSAASLEDVVDFFKRFYTPNNASVCIAGDIDPKATLSLVKKWFGEIPPGPPVPPLAPPAAFLADERRLTYEDNVSLPRLYFAWLTPPSFAPGDAEMDLLASVLAGGKNSRLYKRLVYELQIAQDVIAYQSSRRLGSSFHIEVTARSGHTLAEVEAVLREELGKIRSEPPSVRELGRAVNQIESSFLDRMERSGGFYGKADLLNSYYVRTGNPDYFQEDLSRYRALDPQDLQAAAQEFLGERDLVVLNIVPVGQKGLASGNGEAVHFK